MVRAVTEKICCGKIGIGVMIGIYVEKVTVVTEKFRSKRIGVESDSCGREDLLWKDGYRR
jgi:hypothetical protein